MQFLERLPLISNPIKEYQRRDTLVWPLMLDMIGSVGQCGWVGGYLDVGAKT